MKSVLEENTRLELIRRISQLNTASMANWGKMNVCQMLKHCTLCEEMYLGKTKYKRALLGRLFGRFGLKSLLKDETPIKPNSPTSPHFKVNETTCDVEAEKVKWIELIKEYGNYSNDDFEHWFFGKMTKEQVGLFVFKHTDHHLRQFGV